MHGHVAQPDAPCDIHDTKSMLVHSVLQHIYARVSACKQLANNVSKKMLLCVSMPELQQALLLIGRVH